MSTIDDGSTTYTFLTMQGQVNPLSERLEIITRPGVDGHAYRRLGSGATPFRLRTLVDVDDAAAITTTLAGYKAFVSKLVTVTDAHGNATTNVMVLDVRPVAEQSILTAVGFLSTTATKLLTVDWTLQETNVP